MTDLDQLYRASLDLLKTVRSRELAAQNDAIVSALQPNKAFSIKSSCKIERDWVDAIEKGLDFIGKAISEERQFIRSNGEIQPIEKVKHISRESVEHLARHSDFITRAQQTENIVPEKLYTVERLNDYAVYENRFLYMLLCKLKDFVAVRYNKISKITNRYYGELTMHKSVAYGKNKLEFEVSLKDRREDDPIMKSKNSAKALLERLDEIQRNINFYLRTPLMIEVSKADKIKSTVTKTNILRMDKNFKETVALYEFIMAYNKDGYTVTEEQCVIDPQQEKFEQEFAISAMLSSFYTYEHSLGIEGQLQEEYEKEEQRRREQEQLLLAERIKNLAKRVHTMGMDMEQYMLLLEERNAQLEEDREKLKLARIEIEQLSTKIASMQEQIDAYDRKIADMQEAHAYEINRLNEAHAAEIKELNEAHTEYVTQLKESHDREISNLNDAHESELNSVRDYYDSQVRSRDEQIARLNEDMQASQSAHEAEIARINGECDRKIAEITSLSESRVDESNAYIAQKDLEVKMMEERMQTLSREKTLSDARLASLRAEHGLLTQADDFKSEEAFNELEHQFEVLGKLVRTEWKGVKKMLRKEFYNSIKDTMFKKKKPTEEELENFRKEGRIYSGEPEVITQEKPVPKAKRKKNKKSDTLSEKPIDKTSDDTILPVGSEESDTYPLAESNDQEASDKYSTDSEGPDIYFLAESNDNSIYSDDTKTDDNVNMTAETDE